MNTKNRANWLGRHPKLRATLPVLVFTLAASALVFGINRPATPPAPPPTSVVERGDIAQTVQAGGLVQPKRRVEVGAQTSGLIQRLHVKLGDWVKAGDLLISLDPATARTVVQQAEAQLAQQQASHKRVQVALNAARRDAERESRLLAGDATTAVVAEQAATRLADLEADVQGQQAAMAQRKADLADKRLQLGRVQVHAPMDGQVVNRQGTLADVSVVLVPNVRRRTELYRTTTTDVSGRFHLDRVPPGDYKVFSWEEVEDGAWYDPEFLRANENRGVPIRIVDGQTASVQAEVIQ